MVTSNNIVPGMVLSIGSKLYQVESTVKVTAPKGAPFIKVKMRDLSSKRVSEKNFKPTQSLTTVSPATRRLEYMYLEGKDYLFMDIDKLEQVLIPAKVIGNKVSYLKEGTEISASVYADLVISVELPQFLELMVTNTKGDDEMAPMANATKSAELETGAMLEVPPFIEVGDIIKVDTSTNEYIQRV